MISIISLYLNIIIDTYIIIMNSSYLEKLDYGNIFSLTTFLNSPKNIIEFGILDGYSLQEFAESCSNDCSIKAYDIFGEFNGNHADQNKLQEIFKDYSNVKIQYGDFYKKIAEIEDNSIDILHIDIANNGDVYEFVFQNYIKKMTTEGIILMEGGSIERDNIDWMNKYNKPKMQPILQKYSNIYQIKTIGSIPALTIVKL